MDSVNYSGVIEYGSPNMVCQAVVAWSSYEYQFERKSFINFLSSVMSFAILVITYKLKASVFT